MALNSPTITRRTALLGGAATAALLGTPAAGRADAARADEGSGL